MKVLHITAKQQKKNHPKNNPSRDVSHIKATRQMLGSLMRGKQEGAGFYEEALQNRGAPGHCSLLLTVAPEQTQKQRFCWDGAILPNDDSIS